MDGPTRRRPQLSHGKFLPQSPSSLISNRTEALVQVFSSQGSSVEQKTDRARTAREPLTPNEQRRGQEGSSRCSAKPGNTSKDSPGRTTWHVPDGISEAPAGERQCHTNAAAPQDSGVTAGAALAARLKHGLNESHKSHSLPAREIRGMRGCWKPRCQSGVRKAGLAVPEIPRACADRSGTSLGRSRREAPLVPRRVAMAQMCPGTPISVSWWAQHPPGSLPGSRGAKWGLWEVGRAPQEGPAPPGPQRSAGEGIAPEELRGSKVWGLWW